MKAETISKMRACKELRGKTVGDIVEMPLFRDNLAAYWQAQKADREAIQASYKAMRKLSTQKGYKLPSHVIDKLSMLSVDEFIQEWKEVYSGESDRPKNQREYIKQLARQAYNLTVCQIICKEFPELEAELLPKKN